MPLIESGSRTPGVDPADFRLPPHTAIRIELPDPALRPFVSEYHVLDSDGPAADGSWETWMLPAWPMIRVVLADRRMELTIGNRRYQPVHLASLYGTTTRAGVARPFGGITIGASLSPLGWARLFAAPADGFRDRIVPLADALPVAIVDDLVARLRAVTDAAMIAPTLDGFFAGHLAAASHDEARIAALVALIDDDATRDIAAAAAAVGLDALALRRLSTRYFGFPPKTLLLRARFMRTLVPMLLAGRADYSALPAAYHDASHFLRDANRFLTMTPQRFMRIDQPYLYAALRARAIVRAADVALRADPHPVAA